MRAGTGRTFASYRRAGAGFAACAVLTAAAVAAARPPMRLIPVDEGVGDVDSLAADLRVQPLDLRTPLGFERVYRVPGRDDLYMRVSGGLVAVFPRSEYVPGPGGLWPVIPAGTRFYPGGLPPELLGSPEPAPGGGTAGPERISLSQPLQGQPLMRAADLEAERARQIAEERVTPRSGQSIWGNEAYRSERLDALISAAGSLNH